MTLEDRLSQEEGWIYMTGMQALVRLPIQQRKRDQAAGLNTGGYISGYRGSPVGTYDMSLKQAEKQLKAHNIYFQPGVNEDLAATATWGAQMVGLFPGAKVAASIGRCPGRRNENSDEIEMAMTGRTREAVSTQRSTLRLLAMVACLCGWGDLALAQAAASLSGPSSVPTQIRNNDAAARTAALVGIDPLKELQDTNARLESEYGLTLGTDYQALFQHATESPGAQNAAGNVLRLYGQWSPFARRSADGSLVFKVEYRGKLGTSITPQALGPEVGYAGLTSVTFSDAGGLLTNLYWKQAFDDNRFAFVAGVVDVTDYLDVYALVNPWTDFNNLSFSTNPTIPAPNQGLGAAAGWRFAPNYYVLGGIADANGNPHQPQDFFSSFFNVREYFYHVELGWIGSWEKRVTDNMHVSLWGQDPRDAAGVDRGRGITFSASGTVNERWTPFLRAGYSSGGGALVDRMVSAGLGYRLNDRSDYIGFGAGWARPPAVSPGARVENQYTLETYYRLQLLPQVQIVPSVQFINNPPNNPTADSLWVFSMRLRAAF